MLTRITAVSEGYPLRGELLVTAEIMFADDRNRPTGVPAPRRTHGPNPDLLGRMEYARSATRIMIGEATLTISRVLEYQPGQMAGGMASDGARHVMVNLADDVPSFNVIRPGSRATYQDFFSRHRGTQIEDYRQVVDRAGVTAAFVRGHGARRGRRADHGRDRPRATVSVAGFARHRDPGRGRDGDGRSAAMRSGTSTRSRC